MFFELFLILHTKKNTNGFLSIVYAAHHNIFLFWLRGLVNYEKGKNSYAEMSLSGPSHVGTSASGETTDGPRVIPFAVRVSKPIALLDISLENRVSLMDLRRVNPQISFATTCTDPLPVGTVVRLPPTLHVRGQSIGGSFHVASVWKRLSAAREALQNLRGETPSPECSILPALSRTVKSKMEQLSEFVKEDSERQLKGFRQQLVSPLDAAILSQRATDDAVDCEPTKQFIGALEINFAACGLHSLKPQYQKLMGSVPPKGPPNVLTESKWNSVRDAEAGAEDPSCPFHHHQLEFAFYRPRSVGEPQETWAVLPCQKLTALVDALECPTADLPYPVSRNSFMFIYGVFYVDDRVEPFEDLTVVIRSFNSANPRRAVDGANPAYGQCPVKNMSQTRFADLTLCHQELCVFRHLGNCDHYFFLSDIQEVRGSGREGAAETRRGYPRRVALSPVKIMYCQMCTYLPATILTYGDRLTPHNPTLFCEPCYVLLHADASGEVRADGFIKFQLPHGKHF